MVVFLENTNLSSPFTIFVSLMGMLSNTGTAAGDVHPIITSTCTSSTKLSAMEMIMIINMCTHNTNHHLPH